MIDILNSFTAGINERIQDVILQVVPSLDNCDANLKKHPASTRFEFRDLCVTGVMLYHF